MTVNTVRLSCLQSTFVIDLHSHTLKMRRTHTCTISTKMIKRLTFQQLRVNHLVGITMGSDSVALGLTKESIPVSISIRCPLPTTIKIYTNLGPEVSHDYHRSG